MIKEDAVDALQFSGDDCNHVRLFEFISFDSDYMRNSHPDSNNGDTRFLCVIFQAFDYLEKYINSSTDINDDSTIDEDNKYYMICAFIYNSIVLGFDSAINRNKISIRYGDLFEFIDAYAKKDIKDNISHDDVESAIKKVMIDTFISNYGKSFEKMGIVDPNGFFGKLRSESCSLEEVYATLKIKFDNYLRPFYDKYMPLIKYDLSENVAKRVIDRYAVSHLYENTNDGPGYLRFMSRLKFFSKDWLINSKDYHYSVYLYHMPLVSLELNRSIPTEESLVFNDGDVVIDTVNRRIGIVFTEDGIHSVKYYSSDVDADEIETEICSFNPSEWERIDNYIDENDMVSSRVVRYTDSEVSVEQSCVIYDENDGSLLVSNPDHSRFYVSSKSSIDSLKKENYKVIAMWPDFASKDSMKRKVKEATTKLLFPPEKGKVEIKRTCN